MSRHRVGTALLLLILASSLTVGRGPSEKDNKPRKESGVTAELEKLSQLWYRAWLEKDAATVERMMADDYVYVAPDGQAQDRAAILRIIRSPGYRLHRFDRSEIVVRLLADGAVIIRSRGQGEGDYEGKRFKDDQALLQAWSRVGKEWKLVLEQATAKKQ
jgi:hypothetical protein